MTTLSELIDAVRAVADTRSNASKASLGTPGDKVKLGAPPCTLMDTGQAWGEDKAFQILLEGIAGLLDATIVFKVNELCASLNQLIDDHNSGSVPTSASKVDIIA